MLTKACIVHYMPKLNVDVTTNNFNEAMLFSAKYNYISILGSFTKHFKISH